MINRFAMFAGPTRASAMHYHREHATATIPMIMIRETDTPANDADIERLLDRLKAGDKSAMDALSTLLFEDLRRLARAQRHRLGGGETLRTTALIHETYLKMRRSTNLSAHSRRHFLHTAALAMRQILIDHARSQLALLERQQIVHAEEANRQRDLNQQAKLVLDIDAALDRLGKNEPRLVEVVNYRYFAGCSEDETADLLEVSPRTVRRDWFKAKAWLADALNAHDDATPVL